MKNENLYQPTTKAGEKLAKEWDQKIETVRKNLRKAERLLEKKRGTLAPTLFDTPEVTLFGVQDEPHTEDRYAALQSYVDDIAALKRELCDTVKHRNNAVRNADSDENRQMSWTDSYKV